MTRRYAEGFPDGRLRPSSNLLTCLIVAVSRFLETPKGWDGELTDDEKRGIIDHIKEAVSTSLVALSKRRLREQPQPEWHSAYTSHIGEPGGTRRRRDDVEAIYAQCVPIPKSGDPDAEEFLNDVKSIVLTAIENVRKEVEAQRANGTADTEDLLSQFGELTNVEPTPKHT